MSTKAYNKYLNSSMWRKRREKFYNDFGKKCEFCQITEQIQCHHRSYRNAFYGEEEDRDLIALCKKHHWRIANIKNKIDIKDIINPRNLINNFL